MGTKFTKNILVIPIGLQYMNFKKEYSWWVCELRRNEMVCTGFLQPTDISSKYKVRIIYKVGNKPIIKVLEPELVLSLNGKRNPHIYGKGKPCVYFPYDKEWAPNIYISTSIVPWISSWLYFYEVWLTTEEWRGGGIHLNKIEPIKVKPEQREKQYSKHY